MLKQKTCAYLTLENRDGFFFHDQLTFEPLGKLGWDVVEIPWTRSNVTWGEFDAVVIRSTWDYQKSPRRFQEVLAAIESSGTKLFNSGDICRWNIDKNYLLDVEQQGVPIVTTKWMSGLNESKLLSAFDEFETPEVVAKPTVGANADDTFHLKRNKPEEWPHAFGVLSERQLMLQPFIPSIVEVGEYSLFFFGGQYSHVILKTPELGDFRVQEEHGGQIRSTTIDSDMAKVAQHVIESLSEVLLYARVDLVRDLDQRPALMELELIEPSLYFSFDPEAPVRFANALDQLVRNV